MSPSVSAFIQKWKGSADIEDAEILERLVALNRERSAEEKRGLIRWLRPEYQAPKSGQPLAKPLLDVELEEETSTPAASVGVQLWPKDLRDQLAALWALLLALDQLWSLQDMADAFKSRRRFREGVSTQVELLADLGGITKVETSPGPAFHRPQTLGA